MVEMGNVIDVERSFENDVLKSERLTAVNFWSPYCWHCIDFMPVYEEAAKKYGGQINFTRVEVRKGALIAEEQDITGTPTTKMFYSGVAVATGEGSMDAHEFEQFLRTTYKKVLRKEL